MIVFTFFSLGLGVEPRYAGNRGPHLHDATAAHLKMWIFEENVPKSLRLSTGECTSKEFLALLPQLGWFLPETGDSKTGDLKSCSLRGWRCENWNCTDLPLAIANHSLRIWENGNLQKPIVEGLAKLTARPRLRAVDLCMSECESENGGRGRILPFKSVGPRPLRLSKQVRFHGVSHLGSSS